ncbi:MAG: transposase [Opitutaceae bacterium]|jgi:hypothetical protein|nr:transposase [Opitutaceae bacterium]
MQNLFCFHLRCLCFLLFKNEFFRVPLSANSGFRREEIMAWCETHRVGHILGLARNPRLLAELRPALDAAHQKSILIGASARVYHDFAWQTLESWSWKRRVIGTAGRLGDKDNPRFIVTTLEGPADKLYEEVYCARGGMENHIKEHQLDMFGEKLSCGGFAANQLRLWLCALAYTLMERLRAVALKGGELARATLQTIRLKVLKLAARVETAVRRIRGAPGRCKRGLCRVRACARTPAKTRRLKNHGGKYAARADEGGAVPANREKSQKTAHCGRTAPASVRPSVQSIVISRAVSLRNCPDFTPFKG